MQYDITAVAQEIMLAPEDLQEILAIYIQEGEKICTQIEQEYGAQNAPALAKLFHALKGSSFNLHIDGVGELTARLEQECKAGQLSNVEVILPQIKKEILFLQELLQQRTK